MNKTTLLKLIIFTISMATFFSQMSAVGYKGEQFYDEENDRYVTLLSCDHTENKKLADQQTEDVISKAQQTKKPFIITESINNGLKKYAKKVFPLEQYLNYEQEINQLEEKLLQEEYDDVLTKLPIKSRQKYIPFKSVDFRIFSSLSHEGLAAESIHQCITKKIIDKIKLYRTPFPLLKTYYKKITRIPEEINNAWLKALEKDVLISKSLKAIKQSGYLSRINQNIRNYLEQHYNFDDQKMVESASIQFDTGPNPTEQQITQARQEYYSNQYYYSKLIDALFIRQVEKRTNNKHVVVCGGGDHIKNVSKQLEKIGLKKMYSKGKHKHEDWLYNKISSLNWSTVKKNFLLKLCGYRQLPFFNGFTEKTELRWSKPLNIKKFFKRADLARYQEDIMADSLLLLTQNF